MFKQRTSEIPLVSEALTAPRVVVSQDMAILAFRLGRDGYDASLDTLLAGPDTFDADTAAQAYADGYRAKVNGRFTDEHALMALDAITGSDDAVDPLFGTFVSAYLGKMIEVEQIEQQVE